MNGIRLNDLLVWAFMAGIAFKTLRDLKGVSKRQATQHKALKDTLQSSVWSDTKEKQDSIARLP